MLRRKEQSFYHLVIMSHSLIFPDDWRVYDFKGRSESTIRRPPSFKITESKIMEISAESSGLNVKTTYSGLGCSHGILKRGRTWS